MENQTFSFKKLFIFLIVFIIVAVGVTFALITIKNNSNNSNVITPKNDDVVVPTTRKEVDYTYGLTTLTEKYTTNNIEIEELSYTEGKAFKQYPSSLEYTYPFEIKYFKIHGLKDKTVEEKINTLIKDTAFNLLPTQEADIILIGSYIGANFSNIISISFSITYQNKLNNGNYSFDRNLTAATLNINLKDGNIINIEDIFVDNFDITSLIARSAYETIFGGYYEIWDDETGNPIRVDGEKIESEVFSFMEKIKEKDYIYDISTTGSVVISIPDGRSAYIYLKYHYKCFAFFKRFLTTESLFTGEYNNAQSMYLGFGRTFTEPSDNLIIDKWMIDSFLFEHEDDDYYNNVLLNMLSAKIDAESEYSKKQPDVETVIMLSAGSSKNYSENITKYYIDVLRCELPKSFYDTTFKEAFLNEIRDSVIYPIDVFYDFFDKYAQRSNEISVSYKRTEFFKDNTTGELSNDNSFVIPNSSTELINNSTLNSLGKDELSKAYNEILARHGNDFTDSTLREYFMGLYWYKPVYKKTVSVDELNDIEKQNIEIIKKKINELN